MARSWFADSEMAVVIFLQRLISRKVASCGHCAMLHRIATPVCCTVPRFPILTAILSTLPFRSGLAVQSYFWVAKIHELIEQKMYSKHNRAQPSSALLVILVQ